MDDFKYYIKPEVNVDEDMKTATLIPEQYDILAGEVALRNAPFTKPTFQLSVITIDVVGFVPSGIGWTGRGAIVAYAVPVRSEVVPRNHLFRVCKWPIE